MPIYEFSCLVCNSSFEKLMSLHADVPRCPDCEGGKVKKLVSASSFVLKGGGWYRDHYGLKGGSKKEK